MLLMEFLTWMKETEEMERQMAVRASDGTVRKENKNELTELPLKMTIKGQDGNYIFEIVENKNTQGLTFSSSFIIFMFIQGQ